MKQLAQNLSLLLFGLLFSLIAVEGMSRLVYTQPWYERLIEEQTQNDWTATLRKNSFGLRDHNYATPKPPHAKRILLLGDSFTFGSGVADNEAIFAELLEKQLNTEFAPQGTAIEILNGGLPGSLTEDWVELLEKVRGSFQPDVIVVVVFLRDGARTSAADSFFDPIRKPITEHNQQSWLYRNIYLYKFYQDAKDRQTISTQYAQALNDAYFGGGQTQEWRTAQFNLRKIKAIGAETNTQTALVIFPILAELNDRYSFKAICDLIAKYGIENELPTYNLLPALMGKNAADLWVSPFNQHPNAQGHALVASALLPFFRQLLKGQ
jgi:lysophospholipase L1-like esterase